MTPEEAKRYYLTPGFRARLLYRTQHYWRFWLKQMCNRGARIPARRNRFPDMAARLKRLRNPE